MRILVVGSGGREHALVWKLSQEAEVFSAPGNPGIDEICECHPIPASDFDGLVELAKQLEVDFVVVGPENPLIDGLADKLRFHGISVLGPGANGAQLEGSKAFSKALMEGAGVPTAGFDTFCDFDPALRYAKSRFAEGREVAIKASGNALGKGVVVCSSVEEAEEALRSMLLEKIFGSAGETVVIEDRLYGREFSLLAICSGRDFVTLPIAQDYKRALDMDRGPNTGGMGTYSPVPAVSEELLRRAEREVIAPALNRLMDQRINYRGVLFAGIMVEEGDPYCLEYNVRFGDPETQTVVRRLGSGFADLLFAAANGDPLPELEVLDHSAVSVVLASGGYPGDYEKGKSIQIPTDLPEGVIVFHAGTSCLEGGLRTNGGRVLTVSAVGDRISDARHLAYEACDRIDFEGKSFRTDIGS